LDKIEKLNSANLNDENASLTFWIVPQTITEDVTIEVTFDIYLNGTKTTSSVTREIALGKSVVSAGTNNWLAGQLRTFTITCKDVNVQVTSTTKSNVKILNTGSSDEYIRAAIVANWYDASGNIVFGYTANSEGSFVEPWSISNETYGTFDGLPGDGWVLADDGYYYYTSKVSSGYTTDTPIFNTYTIANVPEVWTGISGNRKQVSGVHLVMEIVVQAVDASKYSTYDAAWAATENNS